MKNSKFVLQLAVLLLISSLSFAQATKTKPRLTAGILGAANITSFRVQNSPFTTVSYESGFGYAGGLWLNLPLTKKWSFEPQFQYSVLNYVGKGNPFKQFSGQLQYQSVPLLLKYKTRMDVAFFAGPQIDFLNSLSNQGTTPYYKSNYEAVTTILTGGVEMFPTGKVQIYARYMYGLSDMKSTTNPNAGTHFYNQGVQLGLKVKLYEKKVVLPPPPPPPPPAPVVEAPKDTDGDGVLDKDDKCPAVAGLAKYQGCPVPDTDGDGINDENDKCPTVKGLAKYQGCPIPDTDKDGINDEEDKCPAVPGLARYQGCPIPDTDADGVNDEEDKCPTVKGTIANNGCPELQTQYKFDSKQIQFLAGSAGLNKKSKMELVKVVLAMTDYPTLKLYVDGYSDNTGSDKINNPLSLKRANTVKAYLFSKKIAAERLLTDGFGSAKPVADNKTAKGRAQNRRVELRVQEL